jgi:hypothetical protein
MADGDFDMLTVTVKVRLYGERDFTKKRTAYKVSGHNSQ